MGTSTAPAGTTIRRGSCAWPARVKMGIEAPQQLAIRRKDIA